MDFVDIVDGVDLVFGGRREGEGCADVRASILWCLTRTAAPETLAASTGKRIQNALPCPDIRT